MEKTKSRPGGPAAGAGPRGGVRGPALHQPASSGPLYRRYVDEMGLRGDERVLDYGCGSGAAARHLAKRLQAGGGRLTCMDVSERWQRTARRALHAYPDVEYRLGDVRAMDLPAASFDVVLVHWMLHDVPPWDRPGIVAELARLLRPGGRLFSREPTNARHGMPAAQVRRGVRRRRPHRDARHRGQGADPRRALPRRLDQAGRLRPPGRRPSRTPILPSPTPVTEVAGSVAHAWPPALRAATSSRRRRRRPRGGPPARSPLQAPESRDPWLS